jgi:hypothetical protein
MAPRESVVHDEKSPYETWSEYHARKRKEVKLVKPVRGANFESKRVRKAKRKALIRGYVGNKIVDVKMEAADRAEFYRNLRLVKLQRRKIAQQMRGLCDQLRALEREVAAVEHRVPTVDLRLVDETHDAVREALKAAVVAADEFFLFSRQKVYYIKETAA